jgi:hypothetical protein
MPVPHIVGKLRTCINSRVKLTFRDDEILIADLDFVLEEENLIIFDLILSNRPDKYERLDKRPHISATISDVVECERFDDEKGQSPIASAS